MLYDKNFLPVVNTLFAFFGINTLYLQIGKNHAAIEEHHSCVCDEHHLNRERTLVCKADDAEERGQQQREENLAGALCASVEIGTDVVITVSQRGNCENFKRISADDGVFGIEFVGK